MKFDCDEGLLAALSYRKGASHDCSSTADDRGHAGAESVSAYASIISPTSIAVRTPLPHLAGYVDPRAYSDLSDLSHKREEAGHQLDTYGCCGASFPLQGDAQERMDLRRGHPASKETTKATHCLEP